MSAAANREVRVPDIGNFKDVAVIDVLVKPGDTVDVDTPLITLESDKATMDVPSTAAGVVDKLHTNKGGKVNTGDLVVTLRGDGALAAEPAKSRPAPGEPATPQTPVASSAPPASDSRSSPPSSPSPPTLTAARPASGGPPGGAPGGAAGGRMMPRSALGTPTSYRSDLAPIDEPGFSR